MNHSPLWKMFQRSEPVGLHAVSSQMGVPHARANRFLNWLAETGAVEREGSGWRMKSRALFVRYAGSVDLEGEQDA